MVISVRRYYAIKALCHHLPLPRSAQIQIANGLFWLLRVKIIEDGQAGILYFMPSGWGRTRKMHALLERVYGRERDSA